MATVGSRLYGHERVRIQPNGGSNPGGQVSIGWSESGDTRSVGTLLIKP
jgi:hypothetical protein